MFTWKPIYQELAGKLMDYDHNRGELLSITMEMLQKGLPVIDFKDKNATGESVELMELDPFSFFAHFNRGLKEENRVNILRYLKERLKLSSELPSDFHGIPVVNMQRAWFFAYSHNRKADDIPALWELAKSCVSDGPEKVNPDLFKRCLNIKQIGVSKLTIGLFWMNPDKYLALDSRMREYLKKRNIRINTNTIKSIDDYLEVVGLVSKNIDNDFPRISHKAYINNGPPYTPEDPETPEPPKSLPLNTILYGPPGTGKTWKLRTEYMDRFTDTSATLSQEEYAASIVSDLAWWKVITMVMMDLKESRVSEIMKHPLMQARIKRSSSANPRAAIWAHIQMHTKQECQNVKYTKRYEPLLFEKDDSSVWSIDLELAEEAVPELKEKLEEFNSFEPGKPTKVERYDFTTFHQSFSYEDFVEGIKPVMPAEDATEEVPDSLSYEVRPGIFKKMVQRALADPKHNYALFIDEINRGNVASIFGELITLIEEDKRQGADHELTATLPYSQTKFVVPKNLYIIGAMNTADRSVEALDTALRRRFTFIAVPPEPETLPAAGEVEGLNVDLRKMLFTINARIQKLLDKDHCIGHSYFLGVSSFEDLQEVFATKILPLLEEYFYGDPARIGRVLGEKFVSRNYESINWASGDWGQEEFDERSIYIIKDPRSLSQEDFKSIYE
jgi:hypothetical protein